jgi:hypothetical protein
MSKGENLFGETREWEMKIVMQPIRVEIHLGIECNFTTHQGKIGGGGGLEETISQKGLLMTILRQ